MRIARASFALLLLVLAGCAHVISEENRKTVDSSITFESLKNAPEKFFGARLMLGGVIAAATNSPEGGQIEIIQYSLTDDGYPDVAQGSAGRFLAASPTHLDTEMYPEGSLITVFGEAKGSRSLTVGDKKTAYPLISLRESHVWLPEEKHSLPFRIPGTNRVDPYYRGIDAPQPNRFNGTTSPPLTAP